MKGLYLFGLIEAVTLVVALAACGGGSEAAADTTLGGVVAQGAAMAGAQVTVVDSQGVRRQASTDAAGRYAVNADGLRVPLLVSSIPAGGNTNCRYNDRPRAACMAAYVVTLREGSNVANVNPLTDRIASDIAVALKYIGPQQLVDSGKAPAVDAAVLQTAITEMRAGFSAALTAAGVTEVAGFDPVSTPMNADGRGVDAVLDLINHTRNYDNNSGESAHAVLTDISFRPIVGLLGNGAYEPLDFARAQRELAEIRNASVRVLVVGDSTAATYELGRLPRMGWGQVFEGRFKAGSRVKVLNGARAGRASRDFYNSGWYGQMARFMKPGDYVIINHGHNDQNCDASKALRGAADVANLCSYPNDAGGHRQHPAGASDMSFQTALERYVTLARMAGATPLLMTPTTRYWNVDRNTAYQGSDTRPVVPNHVTRQNAANGFAFVGDYSQTIRDTANARGVPLIDLEAKTIVFANAHAADWKGYWLAVDPADPRYPYYRTQTTGTLASPDTTHFQQAGAEAVADMVVQGIKETPALASMANLLQ
ncbi:SGNH/GDSL hydrolase family protein [Uliginosibacterium sp. H1]|uniref:SGNH/GDSL hydrolase family protein n=1 Tax=Uliginosibacterium sp. H1 TaxID=3114757 RepID=UPI002E1907F3|nr:SGNH/GDSL hydrolase family protein [Uliginosibacterium sp. H1]